jgi:hypothetical protein
MNSSASNQPSAPDDAWTVQGVRFPSGTEFRATHKGKLYLGSVASGALVVGGKAYHSPTAAAVEITKVSTNGWAFWNCKLPNSEEWVQLKRLRELGESLRSGEQHSTDDV